MKIRRSIVMRQVFTIVGILFLILPFFSAIKIEFGYYCKKIGLCEHVNLTMNGDDGFEILIPKIDVKSKVVAGVDPFDKQIYSQALKQGVAQAKGTSMPGEDGQIYLFAHSTDSLFNVTQYNAEFYLLNKLEAGDDIQLLYNGVRYAYVVTGKEIVSARSVELLNSDVDSHVLVLQTCWPMGTTWKRLLVRAVEL